MSIPQIRAWLFDFDGTLVEPSIDFDQMRRAVLDVVARYGLDPEPFARMHTLEAVARVEAELERRGDGLARAFVREADEAIVMIEVEAARHVSAYEGAPAMLRQLMAMGYRVGIVTRNCRAAVEQVAARNDIRCDILLTRDDVAHVKPDPRHLLAALDALGVLAQHAAMCGDHPMDIAAGRNIGASLTVGVLRPGVPPEYFAEAHPDLVLSRVVELLDHLPGDQPGCHNKAP